MYEDEDSGLWKTSDFAERHEYLQRRPKSTLPAWVDHEIARVSFTATDDLRAHGSFIYLLEIPLQVHHLGSLMLATIVFPYLVKVAPNVQSQGPLEMNVANKPQLPLMTRMLADTVPGTREIGSRVDKVISVTG